MTLKQVMEPSENKATIYHWVVNGDDYLAPRVVDMGYIGEMASVIPEVFVCVYGAAGTKNKIYLNGVEHYEAAKLLPGVNIYDRKTSKFRIVKKGCRFYTPDTRDNALPSFVSGMETLKELLYGEIPSIYIGLSMDTRKEILAAIDSKFDRLSLTHFRWAELSNYAVTLERVYKSITPVSGRATGVTVKSLSRHRRWLSRLFALFFMVESPKKVERVLQNGFFVIPAIETAGFMQKVANIVYKYWLPNVEQPLIDIRWVSDKVIRGERVLVWLQDIIETITQYLHPDENLCPLNTYSPYDLEIALRKFRSLYVTHMCKLARGLTTKTSPLVIYKNKLSKVLVAYEKVIKSKHRYYLQKARKKIRERVKQALYEELQKKGVPPMSENKYKAFIRVILGTRKFHPDIIQDIPVTIKTDEPARAFVTIVTKRVGDRILTSDFVVPIDDTRATNPVTDTANINNYSAPADNGASTFSNLKVTIDENIAREIMEFLASARDNDGEEA